MTQFLPDAIHTKLKNVAEYCYSIKQGKSTVTGRFTTSIEMGANENKSGYAIKSRVAALAFPFFSALSVLQNTQATFNQAVYSLFGAQNEGESLRSELIELSRSILGVVASVFLWIPGIIDPTIYHISSSHEEDPTTLRLSENVSALVVNLSNKSDEVTALETTLSKTSEV